MPHNERRPRGSAVVYAGSVASSLASESVVPLLPQTYVLFKLRLLCRAAAALRPVRSGDADSAVAAQGGAIVEDDGERPGGGAGGEDRNGGGDWGGVRSNNADCGGGGGGGGKAMGGSEGSSDTGTPGGCREVAAAVNLMQVRWQMRTPTKTPCNYVTACALGDVPELVPTALPLPIRSCRPPHSLQNGTRATHS